MDANEYGTLVTLTPVTEKNLEFICDEETNEELWSYEEEVPTDREYQCHGYCTESAKRLIRYAFDNLNAHKVIGMCNCHNIASARIMEKAGMKLQGIFRNEYLCHGEWVDQKYYCILKEEML